MESNVTYATRFTPAEAAEQSRIATAEGLKQVAAALAERAGQNKSPIESADSYDSSDSSESDCGHRKRKRRHVRKNQTEDTGSSEHERRAHYLQLELANAKVDIDELKTEVSKLKTFNDPFAVVNNELSFLKSSIERANRDLDQFTIVQLEKRAALYKDEYSEHIALCNAAIAKVSLAEVKNSFLRVVAAERKRAIKAENSLILTIWVKKTTYKVSIATLVSILVAFVSMLFYWQVSRFF